MKVSEENTRIRLTWEADSVEDIEKARDFFSGLTRQGWLAVRSDGESKRVLDFRPEYGELSFIPIAEGG